MFPLSDSIRPQKFPLVTYIVIVLNILVFIAELFAQDTNLFIQNYALTPSHINIFQPYSLLPFVTSIFLHGGFFHIASNMYFLWIFSDAVEERAGKLRFILIFLVAGVVGNLVQYLLSPSSTIPMLGASGAVSGVLGAYFVFFPKARIKSLLLFFFVLTVTEIPSVLYIGYWFIVQLFSGFASFADFEGGGIAFWAHVGGYAAGYYLAKKFKEKEKMKEDGIIEGEIVD